jgi:hypothetical protein
MQLLGKGVEIDLGQKLPDGLGPMAALKLSSYFSSISRYSSSDKTCFLSWGCGPGRSRCRRRSIIPSPKPWATYQNQPHAGRMPLKYQMWETGAASSIWPIRSLLTLARVTSTPQRSQTLPL